MRKPRRPSGIYLFAGVLAASLLGSRAHAIPSLSTGTQFLPADSARTAMDIGGSWNGSADVRLAAGDGFRFTLTNGALATSAFDLAVTVELPSNFQYVAGTGSVSASGVGCGAAPTATASQVGTTLTFTILPASYDLPADCALTFAYGIVADTTVAAGTYAVQPSWNYSNTNAGPLVGVQNTSQQIVVRAGATLFTLSPSTQTKAVGQSATFTASVCNSGLGGLFDVTIDETLLNPNPANSLQITSMTQTAPLVPAATGTMPVLTVPYLAPGACFNASIVADVTGCSTIVNTASTDERTGTASSSALASITLDLTTPLISYSPGSISVPYTGTQNVSIPIQNTGLGTAYGAVLQTNFDLLPISITNVSAGWSYNASNGNFTRVGGTVLNGATVPLTFDVEQTSCPPVDDTYTVIWQSSYLDGCTNPYVVPSVLQSVNIGGAEPLNVSVTGPSRVNLNQSGTWNVTLTPNDLSQLTTPNIIVTESIPAGFSAAALGTIPPGTTANCGGPPCGPGTSVTWTVPKALLTGALTLPINFTAPSNPCVAGGSFTGTATATSTWGPTPACVFSDADSVRTYIAQTPGFTSTQSFNLATSARGDSSFETGLADGGDGVRQVSAGEGEFLTFSNSFDFGMGQPGTWAGSSYTDNYGGLTGQTLVPGTLVIRLDGAAPVPVPAGSITTSSGSLLIDMAFVAGPLYLNDPNVSAHRIDLEYKTTVNDSDLPLPAEYRDVVGVTSLTVAGGSSGCAGSGSDISFTQPLLYRVYRARVDLALSLPSTLDVCQTVSVTATSSGDAVAGPWNALLTQNTSGNYDYLTGQTPVYGGAFSGNITYAENGGTNPTFTYGPTPLQQGSNGSATYNMRLRAGSSTTPSALTASVAYDDTQSHALPRDLTTNASRTPLLVRSGDIEVVTSPSTLYITGNRARFRIYVVNGGDGVAYGTELRDTLPTGLTPNAAETDPLNPSYAVTVVGQDMSWNLGDIPPGATRTIDVVATAAGSTCSIPDGSNAIQARWGCGGSYHQTKNSSLPNFRFPTGQFQVLHETASTQVGVCDPTGGQALIVGRNTGLTHVYNVALREVLEPGTNGIDIAGSAQYSINGGASWLPVMMAPTGAGTSASPYEWTSAQIPELADIPPQSEGGFYEVRLRFPLSGNEDTNGALTPIRASGIGAVGCGTALNSPGVAMTPTVRRPTMTVTTVGRNGIAGAFDEIVYGKPGDTVQWQVAIQNTGAIAAKNALFTADLPNTPAGPTALLNGPGATNVPLSDGVATTLADVAASSTATYTVSQVLGANCVNQTQQASFTWGCDAVAPHLTTPTNNSDGANLVMAPDFTGSGLAQSFSTLNGGRGEVTITVTNSGAYAQNMVLTSTLPAGIAIDTSFTPTVTSSGAVTAVTVGGTSTVPTFTLTGTLDHATNAVVKFRVIQNTAFDTTSDKFSIPETVGNSFDPSPVASGTNTVRLDLQNGCGDASFVTNNASIDLLTPDLDFNLLTPSTTVVQAGTSYNFDFRIVNNGDAGSVANNFTFTPTIGAGFTVTSTTILQAGTGGTGGACAGTCTSAQLGTLAAAAVARVRITGTANANGSPLTVRGLVTGALHRDDGTATGNNYSLDGAQIKVSGYAQSFVLQGTSESFTNTTSVAIGEEATYRFRGEWFGIDPSDTSSEITSITLRNTLPANLGYVSHASTPSNTVGYTVTGNTAGASGQLNFAVSDIVSPAVTGVFEVDIVARVLNVGSNTQGATITDNAGARFTVFAQTFASNSAADGFGGSQALLHNAATLTVARPVLTFDKRVQNTTTGVAIGQSAVGQASDNLQYEIVVGNTGTAPAFDLSIVDTMPAKLVAVSGAADGLDNDNDGQTDGADVTGEGTFVPGASGTATFNDGNTGLTFGSSLARLNPGQTITLRYAASLGNTVVPAETVNNSAAYTLTSLPGATGSQTGTTGATGTSTGELQLTGNDVAGTTIQSVNFAKTLVSTSVGGDTSTNVFIGEQARFRLAVVLPAGQTPTLRVDDSLPQGLLLVARAAPTFGSAIASCTTPVLVPASVPASGNPLALRWTFNTCDVGTGTAAQRTITIEYDVQVRNIAANADGTTLANSATYTFASFTSAASTVTLTVRTPLLSLPTITVLPTTGADAGDTVTYRFSVQNTGTATAYDLRLGDTLPAGMSYVPGSTTMVAGPAFGEPDVAGQTLSWGRTQGVPQTIDLAAGSTLTFTYQATLVDTVEPSQVLTNGFSYDYTTLSGAPGPNLGTAVGTAGAADGERTGAGTTPNLLLDSGSAFTTVANNFSVAKAKAGDLVSISGFRVGDLVTYTVQATLQEGTVDNFRIEDVLPAGLALVSFDPITPATGAGGFTYTTPSAGTTAPNVGATGTLTWNLGTVVSTGDNSAANQVLTLVYRARVVDAAGIATTPTTQTLSNSAVARYVNSASAAQASTASVAAISAKQPVLSSAVVLRAGQATSVTASETVRYRLTVSNLGASHAYNIVVEDTLPVGLRTATPVTASATLNGVGVTLAAPAYNSTTGVLTWTLSDVQVLDAGQDLVIDLDATVDANIGGNLTLTNSARATESYSLPSAGSPPDRRQYAATSAATVNVTTPSPTNMGKVVDVGTPNVGETIHYTLRIPQTAVNVALHDVVVTDALPTGLRLVSANTVGAIGVTNNSTGNTVSLSMVQVPANGQAVVTVTAVVENIPGNVDAVIRSNTASYTWAMTSGGAAQTAITSPTVGLTIKEPTLTIDQTFVSEVLANVSQGLQQGDTIRYRFTVNNTGTGPAHDIVIRDLATSTLLSPAVIANPNNPGAPSSSTAGGVTTWTWTVPGPLAAGASYVFDVNFTVGAVQPYENLVANSDVAWNSTAGVNADERPGTAVDATAITRTTGPVTFTKVEHTPAPGVYAIGSNVTYRMRMNFIAGQVRLAHFVDTLPSGLVFVSATVQTGFNSQRLGGGSVTFTGVTAGDTGTLDFDLGDVESTGANPAVVLDVVTRVRDVVGNTNGTVITNVAEARFANPNPPGTPVSVPATSNPSVTVIAPALRLALDGPVAVALGTPSTLTARIVNAGTSTAYRPVVEVELPAGMDDYDPSAHTITASVGARTLAVTTDFTPTYTPATRILQIAFTSLNSRIATTETMAIGFNISLDNNTPAGTNFAPVATVTSYLSQTATGTDVRNTTSTLASGTMGTGVGAPDDDTDDAPFTTTAPTLTFIKSVATPSTIPGATLAYTIVVTNSGASDAIITSLSDALPTHFQTGTLTGLSVSPTGAGSVAGTPTASAMGFTLTGATVGQTGGTLTITYSATLKQVLPNATVVENQSTAMVSGYGAPFLSDSANAADDDGTDTGNASSDPNDDDTTKVHVVSAPILTSLKASTDLNGAPLAVGDTLAYTITLTNTGNEHTNSASLQDIVPANTTYVAGSTTLNGNAVADAPGGNSPLVAGIPVQGVSDPAGELRVGATATVTFRVTIDAGVAGGTTISNQAGLAASGDGSGPLPLLQSDDPSTSLSGDPTLNVVGNGPVIRAQKTVVDVGGTPLAPNDTLQYTIVVRNSGTGPATNLVLSDPMPANTTYVATVGSTMFDADGPSTGVGAVTTTDALDGDPVDFSVTAPNRLTMRLPTLAAGAEASLTFQVTVNNGTANGTILSNQASITTTELPVTYTDVDGNPNNGLQPTEIAVGNGPALRFTKQVQDLNGGQVSPGDVLQYTMLLSNVGAGPATSIIVTDPGAPTPTTYVAGSTTRDGNPVTDINPTTSQLFAGLPIPGSLAAGSSTTMQFQVLIPPSTPGNTQISNQATYTATSLSGVSDSDLDDTFDTDSSGNPTDDDPTVVQVGATVGEASVSGYVWRDDDRSGTLNGAEPGQGGWKVEVLQRGTLVATAVTVADGSYIVRNLPPGTGYQIRFRHPVSNVVYGNVKSAAVGATTNTGIIDNLTLPSGLTVLQQNLPLDPSGIFYNSVTRQPVSGVTARILGPPGFDPNTMLLPMQHNQVSANDGRYRFDLLPAAPAGVYRIEASVPAGMLPLASSILPPQAGVLLSFGQPSPFAVVPLNAVPTGNDPTTYYLQFDLTPGNPAQPDVVNNHIAIDPILGGAITIVKSTPLVTARRGDLVPYTVRAKNNLQATLTNIDLLDTLPPGFKYVEGSGRIGTTNVEPTRVGRALTWSNLTFTSGEEKILRLVTIAGAGVGDGRYINDAVARNNVAQAEVSNHGTATVTIVPDETFDCPEVIGKIYDDRNRNGTQDEGEPGLPGVRVATARGWLITSDEFGRFHVTCPLIPRATFGSNFVMKVDERTLPTGYRMTTENPHVVKLTMGKMTKINFGASIHRVVRLEVRDAAFVENDVELHDAWKAKLVPVVTVLGDGRSVLRIAYWSTAKDKPLVRKRLAALRRELDRLWKEGRFTTPLLIEEEVSWAKEGVYE